MGDMKSLAGQVGHDGHAIFWPSHSLAFLARASLRHRRHVGRQGQDGPASPTRLAIVGRGTVAFKQQADLATKRERVQRYRQLWLRMGRTSQQPHIGTRILGLARRGSARHVERNRGRPTSHHTLVP
jgi:hypothetical protein